MNDKKVEFKKFVGNHPELINYIKNKDMTWQNFYEIYDIYGDSPDAWNKYFNNDIRQTVTSDKIQELTGLLKNINMDNVQKHVNNAQKAINIIQELTKKTPEVVTKVPRPITKFYGD